MRETKEQKILRLEKKVDELKDQIKLIKKENRKSKHLNLKGIKEFQNEISGYQNKIIELQSNIDALIKQNADTEEKLRNEASYARGYLKGWKDLLILFIMEREFDGKIQPLMPTVGIIKNTNLDYFKINNLAYFWLDFCCDGYGHSLFSVRDLIITFNPKNGLDLTDRQRNKILERIKDNESYKEAIMYIKPYRDDAERGYPDGLRVINEKGREVLKLYEDYLIQLEDLRTYSI